MGAQIERARLRRKISADLVAERAGISRATLCAIGKLEELDIPVRQRAPKRGGDPEMEQKMDLDNTGSSQNPSQKPFLFFLFFGILLILVGKRYKEEITR